MKEKIIGLCYVQVQVGGLA